MLGMGIGVLCEKAFSGMMAFECKATFAKAWGRPRTDERIFLIALLNLDDIMLSAISQSKEEKYCKMPLI